MTSPNGTSQKEDAERDAPRDEPSSDVALTARNLDDERCTRQGLGTGAQYLEPLRQRGRSRSLHPPSVAALSRPPTRSSRDALQCPCRQPKRGSPALPSTERTPMSPPAPETVAALMPQLKDELARARRDPVDLGPRLSRSTRGPRCSRPATRSSSCFASSASQLDTLELPDTAPVILGEIPGPQGAPTVLLYGHYDVVPVGDESKWESPPFEATERDGAIYGRGSADSKSNILMHVGALRAWDGKPPVGIKIVIEGQEETGSAFTTYPPTRPELFAADAMVDRRHGEHPARRADAHDRPPRDGGRHHRGADARRPEALGPVRRRGARCAPRRAPRARVDARRRTATSPSKDCGARSGPARPSATRSSASSPRSRRACRSSAPAGSASASGRALRSP